MTAVPSSGTDRRSDRTVGHALVLIVALVAAAAVAWGAVTTALDPDHTSDLHGVGHWLSTTFAAMTWPVITCLGVVSALHYMCAAVAARAASGIPLGWVELIEVQLAASAANRITPAGLGGASVLSRYLVRRGGVGLAPAAAAVSALAVLGGVADVLAFAILIGLGLLFGLAGAATEVPLLASRSLGLVPLPSGMLAWACAGTASLAVLVLMRCTTARTRVARAYRDFATGIAQLVRHGSRIGLLMGASAGTTLLLAAGFATTAVIGPAGLSVAGFGALMIGYMVAAAAANALPTPGGIGAADAALVGVLLAAGASATPALATVIAFRVMTFWAPALLGLGLVAPLRRRGAL